MAYVLPQSPPRSPADDTNSRPSGLFSPSDSRPSGIFSPCDSRPSGLFSPSDTALRQSGIFSDSNSNARSISVIVRAGDSLPPSVPRSRNPQLGDVESRNHSTSSPRNHLGDRKRTPAERKIYPTVVSDQNMLQMDSIIEDKYDDFDLKTDFGVVNAPNDCFDEKYSESSDMNRNVNSTKYIVDESDNTKKEEVSYQSFESNQIQYNNDQSNTSFNDVSTAKSIDFNSTVENMSFNDVATATIDYNTIQINTNNATTVHNIIPTASINSEDVDTITPTSKKIPKKIAKTCKPIAIAPKIAPMGTLLPLQTAGLMQFVITNNLPIVLPPQQPADQDSRKRSFKCTFDGCGKSSLI